MEIQKSPTTSWRIVLGIAAPIYMLANLYLILIGESVGILLLILANVLYQILLTWLTKRVTDPMPNEEEAQPINKTKIWIQIGILGIIILLTGFASDSVPVWSAIVNWAKALGESNLPAEWFGGPGNAVANPLQYFVIPLVLLLLLGAKPTELGLGKGHQIWKSSVIWLALPVVIWGVLLMTGQLPAQTLARRIIGNTFQNGFFEEFLMRGALQTCLRKIMASPWALTVQAFVFGLWHLRANTDMMDGNLIAGIAFCIISQTAAGFIFGYLFERTRNLVVPSVAHVVMNVLGQTFG